jgi:folate-dependent phosphoribosylglycinamide formyltransferase PurN
MIIFVRKSIYDPQKSGKSMYIVCFISGSGTNYREIAARDMGHHYLVFTNRPGCTGTSIARENKHEVIELSHIPYLKGAKEKYGGGKIPRNCPERLHYEQDSIALIEKKLGRQPDLVCLAGYDQWFTDWTVDRYYPRILNVHPGDTTRGYEGLHWVPAAKAIIAGDTALRSTLFVADKSEDNGPVLAQSAPLDIRLTLSASERQGTAGMIEGLNKITAWLNKENIGSYPDFKTRASEDLQAAMAAICSRLQEALKVDGDWKIYPFAVHDLIARGRVEIEDRTIFVDGRQMPVYGYRPDEHC